MSKLEEIEERIKKLEQRVAKLEGKKADVNSTGKGEGMFDHLGEFTK